MGFWSRVTGKAASQQIITSDQLAESIRDLSQGASGEAVTETTALRVSTVYACVRVLSESVGQLPFGMLRRADDRTRVAETGHKLHQLLHEAPNEFMTAQEFREMSMSHLNLHGESFWFTPRDRDGEVREILPLPGSVKIEIDENWNWTYVVNDGRQERRLKRNDVLYLRGKTHDGIHGVSPLTYMRETIGSAIATQKHASRFFANAATPRGILEREDRFQNVEEAKKFKESFDEAYAGSGNAGSTVLLQGGVKWKPIAINHQDSQFLQTRVFQRGEISASYRVPGHMVNDMEKATLNNMEQMSIEFVVYSLTPWLVRYEQSIKQQLMTDEDRARGLFMGFNVEGLLRGDAKTRAELYAKGIQWGWLSPNEIRQLENSSPRDGGDTFLQPVNMAPSPFVPGDNNAT